MGIYYTVYRWGGLFLLQKSLKVQHLNTSVQLKKTVISNSLLGYIVQSQKTCTTVKN